MTKLYELTLKMSYLESQCINVAHYTNEGSDATAGDLGYNFWSDLGAIFRAAASTALTFDTMDVKNLDDLDDWVELPIAQAGTRTITDIAAWIAVAIRLERTDRRFRPGSKRIPSVGEEDIEEGGALNSTAIALFDAVGDAWSTEITGSAAALYYPVVLHLPTEDWPERATSPITGYVNYGLTSQVSRKLGR